MYRRKFIVGIAGLSLAACGGGADPNLVSAQAVADINLIAVSVDAVLTAAGQAPTIPAAIVVRVEAAVAEIKSAALAVTPSIAKAAAAPSVASMEAAVTDIVAALAGLPLPARVQQALQAAVVLLPVIEASIGMAAAAQARPGSMTPADARAALARVGG